MLKVKFKQQFKHSNNSEKQKQLKKHMFTESAVK